MRPEEEHVPDSGRTRVDTAELTAVAAHVADVAATVGAAARPLRTPSARGAFGPGADGERARERYEAARETLTQTVEGLRAALERHGETLHWYAHACERTEDDNLAAAHRVQTGLEPPR